MSYRTLTRFFYSAYRLSLAAAFSSALLSLFSFLASSPLFVPLALLSFLFFLLASRAGRAYASSFDHALTSKLASDAFPSSPSLSRRQRDARARAKRRFSS